MGTFLLWTGVLRSWYTDRPSRFMCQAKTQTIIRQSSTRHPSSLGHPAFETSSPRKACGLYVWDAPSALLYWWCRHLEKDCIYEGRGGSRFVRVRPGSVLQLLHPCSQHSPDRCIICGGCYRDHLILGWVKHLYKPFDRMLDKEYNDCLVSPVIRKSTSGGTRHAFHRRYILDISHKIVDKKGNRLPYKERIRILKQEFVSRFGNSSGSPVAVVSSNGALYLPDRSQAGERPSLLISLCRLLLVNSVTAMYRLQLHDNSVLSAKNKE